MQQNFDEMIIFTRISVSSLIQRYSTNPLLRSNSIKNTKSLATQTGNSLLYPSIVRSNNTRVPRSFKKHKMISFAKESLEIYRGKRVVKTKKQRVYNLQEGGLWKFGRQVTRVGKLLSAIFISRRNSRQPNRGRESELFTCLFGPFSYSGENT